MTRSITAASQLDAMLANQVKVLDGMCARFQMGHVFSSTLYSNGCNWAVATRVLDPLCEDCRVAMGAFIGDLQARFNIPVLIARS